MTKSRKKYMKEYRRTHREQVNAYNRRYYSKHRKERIRVVRAWRKQHHDAIMNMSDEDFLIAAGIREVPDNADL